MGLAWAGDASSDLESGRRTVINAGLVFTVLTLVAAGIAASADVETTLPWCLAVGLFQVIAICLFILGDKPVENPLNNPKLRANLFAEYL